MAESGVSRIARSIEAAEDASCASDPETSATDEFPLALLECISYGGQANVSKGYHREHGFVAVKVFPPGQQEAFRKHLMLLGRIPPHPNVVRALDHAAHGGWCCVVMPLYPRSLRDVLQGGRLPPAASLSVVEDLCRGLYHCHTCGVRHRDIKPDNVLIDDAGHAVLADLDIAATGEQLRTGLSGLTGSLNYMAPEQVAGRSAAIGQGADVWGVAVTVCELLTGEVPFRADTQAELKHRIMHNPPDLPSSLPPAIREVLAKALSKDPDNRHRSAQAFAADYGAAVRKHHGSARTYFSRVSRWRLRSRKPLITRRRAALAVCFLGLIYVLLPSRGPQLMSAKVDAAVQLLEDLHEHMGHAGFREGPTHQSNESILHTLATGSSILRRTPKWTLPADAWPIWDSNERALRTLYIRYQSSAGESEVVPPRGRDEPSFKAVFDEVDRLARWSEVTQASTLETKRQASTLETKRPRDATELNSHTFLCPICGQTIIRFYWVPRRDPGLQGGQ